MKIIAGTADVLPAGLLFDIARYRYRVFVERMGWDLPTVGRLELDAYDRRDTCYIAAIDRSGELVGTARLLSTDRPYLLADMFPQLMPNEPLPRRADIWELSRFAVTDVNTTPVKTDLNFASALALDVLSACISVAHSAGVQRLISVSPMGIERILRHARLHTARAGPTVVVDGRRLFACWIDVDTKWRPLRESTMRPLRSTTAGMND